MSKSDENDLSRINTLDSPDVIRTKIKKLKTDVVLGVEWDNPDRPESTNLLSIYHAVQQTSSVSKTKKEIIYKGKDMPWSEFKPILAEAIVVQTKYSELIEDPDCLDGVLRDGDVANDSIAPKTLDSTKVTMGFTRRK